MRKRIGVLLATIFYYTGLVSLFRRRMRRMGKRVVILNYHRADGGDLRRQMLYLRRHYRIMHLEDALEQLYTPSSMHDTDRRTIAVFTFDDGYYDNYTYGFPLACELHVPITIFLVPGYVENGHQFWWCEGNHLVRRSGVTIVTVDDVTYDLSTSEGKARLTRYIDKHLRHARSVDEREIFLERVRSLLAVSPILTAEEEKDRPLSWGELLKMQESGWVSFGAHTMNHPVLSYLSQAADMRYEIEASRQVLEQKLGHPIRTFAYPVGKEEHINQTVVDTVKDAGFSWAVTAISGVASPGDQPLLIHRLPTDCQRHWLVLAAECAGIWQYFAPFWKKVIGK